MKLKNISILGAMLLQLAAILYNPSAAEAQVVVESPLASASERPHWIWSERLGRPVPRVSLSKKISVDRSLRTVQLSGGADFCHLSIVINDEVVAVIDAFADWFEVDVTRYFRQGENQLELRCDAVEGPAAVALEVKLALGDGQTQRHVTDKTWAAALRASNPNDNAGPEDQPSVTSYGQVLSRMWLPARPAKIEPFDDYTQWRRALRNQDGSSTEGADAATFDIQPGYQIEHLLQASVDHGSWVSMGVAGASDGKLSRAGVLIGREDQGFLRVRFEDGRAVLADAPCDLELREARGIVGLGSSGSAWAVNANNSQAVFTLNDDGERLTATKRLDFPGGMGHGRNDLIWTLSAAAQWNSKTEALTNNSRPVIYSIHGDSVDLPSGDDVTDRTSPLRRGRGNAKTREGHLLQFGGLLPRDNKAPQKPWEVSVIAAGLRNPFGVAMNQHGEKFTYDADAEFDMGAPWYRPTRIVHLVSGADYGWRGVTGQWPPYFPDHADNALPLCDVGKGSPTSVAFGYPAEFPEPDREALYVLDWAYGRVLRVHMTPRGAGYRARCETFLQGRPLNVTDLGFYDGSLLLITGGRKTQSNMYRVRFTGKMRDTALTRQQTRREAFGRRQRLARRRLERFHGMLDGSATERRNVIQRELLPYLSDADPQLRYAARIALEHQPVDDWRALAWAETNVAAAITLLTSLAVTPDAPHEEILQKLNGMDWQSLPPAEQSRMVRCDALCLQAEISPESRLASQKRHRAMLEKVAGRRQFLPTGLAVGIERQLLQLLLRQQVAEATALAMERLEVAATQQDELFLLYALRTTRTGWTPELRRRYFAAFENTRGYLAGDGMPGFIRQIHQQAVETTTAEERAMLGDLATLSTGVSSEPLPEPRPLIEAWKLNALDATLARLPAGDARRGRQVFHDALCARCHRVGAEGRPIGPELTNVGNRFRRVDLLRSVLMPSDVVAEKYRQHVVVTDDGRQITGIGAWGGDYRRPTLRLVTNPLRPDEAIEVPKKEIVQRRLSETSPMPDGLLNGFKAEEIQDLLAYLMGN